MTRRNAKPLIPLSHHEVLVAFLTLEDPNAKIKGSRDPLGVQPLWITFGRQVVGNLTTQSTSVRGFTILLLARYFAADLVDRGMATKEEALDIFLKMEQVGAYARYAAHGADDIRGIERVKRYFDEYRRRVPIHADRRGMILSDQKVYGLWGLYSVPARTSGLIPDGPLDVEPDSRRLIETRYLPHLNGATAPLRRLLAKGGTLEARERDPIFHAMTRILSPRFDAVELDFYRRTLRDGLDVVGMPAGRQEHVRKLLEAHTKLDEPAGRNDVLRLARAAGQRDDALAARLLRIAALEALLAPADALFQHLLMQHGRPVAQVATEVLDRWKRVPHLDEATWQEILPEVRETAGVALATRMTQCYRALRTGKMLDAIVALVDWNEVVMRSRGGAPWIIINAGQFDVRYRGSERLLPERDELSALWTNPYFIDSLKNVTRQLQD